MCGVHDALFLRTLGVLFGDDLIDDFEFLNQCDCPGHVSRSRFGWDEWSYLFLDGVHDVKLSENPSDNFVVFKSSVVVWGFGWYDHLDVVYQFVWGSDFQLKSRGWLFTGGRVRSMVEDRTVMAFALLWLLTAAMVIRLVLSNEYLFASKKRMLIELGCSVVVLLFSFLIGVCLIW